NPRNIEIPIGVGVLNISIENSKIQLQNWVFLGYQVALAWRQGSVELRTPEDDLLDSTKKAMSEQDWGIGCKTSRGNA
ncbi:MAG: hypothetical protein ACKVHC_02780, partial [Candidatus Poseidoniales archaeon]